MKIPPAVKNLLGIAALMLAGCATPGVDWDRQVGEMTFDQAVDLMGAPDRSEKLDNGKMVVEWISRYDTGSAAKSDNDFRYQSVGESLNRKSRVVPESCLQLTFGTNNVLADWSKK
jgi:hypothetical protein